MVHYHIEGESQRAKVTTGKDGAYIMYIKGEKYAFPGFPRGHLLYGTLSPLKHYIKTQLFNESWRMLEEGKSSEDVALYVKQTVIPRMVELADEFRIHLLPRERMVSVVRAIWDGFEKIENGDKRIKALKECLCYVLQEDDSYRFRVQFLISFFNPSSWWRRLLKRSPIDDFKTALTWLEYAEVLDDMKGRIKLLRRILIALLQDTTIRRLFLELCSSVNWNKIKLTEADRYYFRAKYFKADFDKGYEY